MGCSGSAGTSTVALLIAQSFARSRLVECAPGAASGLAGASTAELGEAEQGVEGSRGELRIQRRRDQLYRPRRKCRGPLPSSPGAISVVDSGWGLRRILAGAAGTTELASSAASSRPGRARGPCPACGSWRATWHYSNRSGVGPSRPVCRPVVGCGRSNAMGLHRHLRQTGRLISLPHNAALALSGITTDPLPRSFHHAASCSRRGLLP